MQLGWQCSPSKANRKAISGSRGERPSGWQNVRHLWAVWRQVHNCLWFGRRVRGQREASCSPKEQVHVLFARNELCIWYANASKSEREAHQTIPETVGPKSLSHRCWLKVKELSIERRSTGVALTLSPLGNCKWYFCPVCRAANTLTPKRDNWFWI